MCAIPMNKVKKKGATNNMLQSLIRKRIKKKVMETQPQAQIISDNE